jgi:hypothetical protein
MKELSLSSHCIKESISANPIGINVNMPNPIRFGAIKLYAMAVLRSFLFFPF